MIGGSGLESRAPHLVFVVLGSMTSLNPIAALKQGLADEPRNRTYGIRGFRCSQCGALEFYADADPSE